MARDAAELRNELDSMARAVEDGLLHSDPLWLRYSSWRFGLPGATKVGRLLVPAMGHDASLVGIDQERDQDRHTLVVATDGVYHTKRSRLSDGWVERVGVSEVAGVDVEQSSFGSSRFLDLVVTDLRGDAALSYRLGQFTPTGFDQQDSMRIDELRAAQTRVLAALDRVGLK